MKMMNYASGLIPVCLFLLSGGAQDRPSPEVNLTVSGCPKITRCHLEPSAPRSNGELLAALDDAEAAWAKCADKVDTT